MSMFMSQALKRAIRVKNTFEEEVRYLRSVGLPLTDDQIERAKMQAVLLSERTALSPIAAIRQVRLILEGVLQEDRRNA